ncbi:DUF2326 domain-containing protein [Candidatus Gracilibacteria bacterium]|nr:DUF2326 domain-containing protein [Candidatus Gracilibacteria bacterium]NUJ99142.1 DUF2326 domain-containing protein [Candidatus Gracilibacteria bacterium]
MKLSKIYSNKSIFKEIIFNEYLNIIYGNIEDHLTNVNAQEHNLGKTSLVYLIDFLLLKEVKNNNFFGKYKTKFNDWIFFLEIKLNDGNYLTIKRSIKNNNLVSIKKHFSNNQNFTDLLTEWDYSDIKIKTKKDEIKAKDTLNTLLNFNVLDKPGYNYRSFLPYLLRTQDDYGEVFNLDNFFSDSEWKPMIFELLGFNGDILDEKYSLEKNLEFERKHIKKVNLESKVSDSEIYKIKAIIEAKELELKEIKDTIDKFNFFQKEQDINIELVKEIESEISLLNNKEYNLNYNIEEVQNALDNDGGSIIKINELETLFNEVGLNLPDQLVKKYKDVQLFASQISSERKKYLQDELKSKTEERNSIRGKLYELNKKRGDYLYILREKDTFIKYKNYQDLIVKLSGEILVHKEKLISAQGIEKTKGDIDKINDDISLLVDEIKLELNKENIDLIEIKKIFQDIYKKVFQYTVLLIVEPNKKNNINFTTTVLDFANDTTGKGDGYTSTKILCASFVLSILIYYSNKSFYKFAYHDGILESWGDKHKVSFINLLRDYCKKYDIQYSISLIKSDIPNSLIFNKGEIIKELSKGNELFGMEF